MVGRTVLQYQFIEKLGTGGMGEVYKALDTRLNRYVAIKVLVHSTAGDPDRRRRFMREAQAASALNHPNIITIHDIVSEEGAEFMVMEYVAGKTLVELIPNGGLRAPQALQYSIQIADALQVAHNAGIVHRDLKPSNVMVTETGLVKILDFGLAKLAEAGPMRDMDGSTDETQTIAEGPLTMEGAIIGTVSYMSPEQAQGNKLDTRSDIFSFGVVLYEMLTGIRAFSGDSALATLSSILRDDVRPIAEITRDVPPQFEMVIERCLRKLPDDRWQTMKDVQMALAALKHESESGRLKAMPLPQIRTTPPHVAAVSAKRKPLPVAAIAGVLGGLALLSIGGGTAYWIKHRHEAAKPSAETAATAVAQPIPAPAFAPASPVPDAPPAVPATAGAPAAASAGDATLTNATIVDMVAAKVSPRVIMSQIRSSNTNFTLTPSALIQLTRAGVPEDVIEQMRNPKRAVPPQSTVIAAVPSSIKSAPAPPSTTQQSSPQSPPPSQPQNSQPQASQPQISQPPPQTTPAPAQEPAPQPPQTAPAKAPVSTTFVALRDGLPVPITLAEDIPDNVDEGRPLRFTVTTDVHIGGVLAIAKGATVTGAIAEVPGKKKKLGFIGGGKLTFQVTQADAVDGQKIKIRALQARRSDGIYYRPVEAVPRKIKDLAASAGAAYIAYVDGDHTVAGRP